MSLPVKLLIAFLVWLLYFMLTFYGCHDELCHACDEAATEAAITTGDSSQVAVRNYPLYFQWSDPQAYTNDNFDSLRQAILSRMKDDNILEITGQYFEEEPVPEGFDNMGFARAAQAKALLGDAIPEGRIELRARNVDEREGVRTNPFEAASFDWESPKETIVETVEEFDDRIIIRFPFGSTERVYDPAVDEYLEKLAARVKETGEQVTLTGHTDNVDSDEYNQQLGMDRALGIKQILVENGVPASQVTTSSKGESQPVASNDKEEGRYENRRVELRLIKKQ